MAPTLNLFLHAMAIAFFALSLFLGRAMATGVEPTFATNFERMNNESLFWGPYKPNLYFGVRPRSPHGLWTGLMWGKMNSYEDMQSDLRYTCEQNEGIHGYGWDEYDIRTGGIQTIHDEKNMIDITTSFVKIPKGDNGGSWAVRVKGVPRLDAPVDSITMLHFYIAQDSVNSSIDPDLPTILGKSDDASFTGQSEELGKYELLVTKGTGNHPTSDHPVSESRPGNQITVFTLNIPEDYQWKAKEVVYKQLRDAARQAQDMDPKNLPPAWQMFALPHKAAYESTHIVQRIFQGAFEFDVVFSAGDAQLTSDDVTAHIDSTRDDFAQRFSRTFSPKSPFDDVDHARFAKSMFSNLFGGVGYFHGEHMVDRSDAPEYDEDEEGFWVEATIAQARRAFRPEGPHELFTSIPSRPFFPRGFLWDEGFHLLPIADWDLDASLDIVRSWFELMDDDGWIAREQILGPEARSKVPQEFQVQYPHYANPPTLYLVIEAFVERLRAASAKSETEGSTTSAATVPSQRTSHLVSPALGEHFLQKLYPLLRRQHDWFRRTQGGDLRSYDRRATSQREAYRWRGRTEFHILTSGLDDYPRPQPPHPGELHVDLLSWMVLMTRVLGSVAEAIGELDDAVELRRMLVGMRANIDDLHWSEEAGCWCDATVDEFEEHLLVCHKGYVSISPFLTGAIEPDSPKMGRILDLIGDEDELWSPHGLRSLSKSDPLYGTKENYWRSPVWVNMNYLALVQLQNVARQSGPYRTKAADLYNRLRRNVVDTVFASWVSTGFAWEQYNPETGAGQRTQHFTGWTSLVVKMMAMDEEAVSSTEASPDSSDKTDEKLEL